MDPRAVRARLRAEARREEVGMSASQLNAETAKLRAKNLLLERETKELEDRARGNRPEPVLHKGVIKGVLEADRPAFMRLALSLRVNAEFIENR